MIHKINILKRSVFLLMAGIVLIFSCKNVPGGKRQLSDKDRIKLEASTNPGIENKVQKLLSKMTLEERIEQMVQIMTGENIDNPFMDTIVKKCIY